MFVLKYIYKYKLFFSLLLLLLFSVAIFFVDPHFLKIP